VSNRSNIIELLKLKKFSEALALAESDLSQLKIDAPIEERAYAEIYKAICLFRLDELAACRHIFNEYFTFLTENISKKWDGKELVSTYLAFNELDKALLYLDSYLKFNPSNDAVLFQKCSLLYKANQYEHAIPILEELLLRKSNNAEVQFLLGLNLVSINPNRSFQLFEHALANGKDEALTEIMKLLLVRKGICDYKNCTNCCCKGVSLKGSDGKFITNANALKILQETDERNTCWFPSGTTKDNVMVFNCKHHNSDNSCAAYSQRPQVCIDYPAHILQLRKACSYYFELKEDTPAFSTTLAYKVVKEFLETSGYALAAKKLLVKAK
jgi:tetratricopeptide (TPR) repeat protein